MVATTFIYASNFKMLKWNQNMDLITVLSDLPVCRGSG